MREFVLVIAAGVALVFSNPAQARTPTHHHRDVMSRFGVTPRIGGYGLRGSGEAGAMLRRDDAGTHAGSGWYQPGWGGTLNPGWGYSFGPRLGGSGL